MHGRSCSFLAAKHIREGPMCTMKNAQPEYTDDGRDYLVVNELLQVQIPDGTDPLTYFSRINDVSGAKLVIAWPTNKGIRLLTHGDQMLAFSLVRDGTPYTFTGLVDDVHPEPLPQITIIISSTVTRVQRRQNFRIKCLVPVEIVGSIKENPRKDETTTLVIRTTTFDLSASGMAIRYPKRIPVGTLLESKLALPDKGPPMKIPCRVVYSENFSESKTQYRTGIHYLAISEWERARIVRYVYRMQLNGLHP